MTRALAVDLVIVLWMLTGSLLLVFMVRRGHGAVKWAIICLSLGPLALLPVYLARRRADAVAALVLSEGRPGPGSLSIVVGVDGSQASHEALLGALDAFGDRLGRLTLAFAIDFDAARSESPRRRKAERTLLDHAVDTKRRIGREPATVVLPGNPASALVDLARQQRDDWIVIGCRGSGNADWLRGSTTTGIEQAGVPVMIITGSPASDRSIDRSTA